MLYGNGNNGKTFIVESTIKHLNKELISARKILGLLDEKTNSPKEIEKLLEKYVISISIDDYREVDNILDYINNNYKKTGKQNKNDTLPGGRGYRDPDTCSDHRLE